MKQKFRTSKDFKSLEKINKSLQRFFKTRILSDLQTVVDLISGTGSDNFYLPTKNLLEYILVRLQGLAKLMEYVIGICTDIAYMLMIRIHTGHFWKIAFITFSIVARIYVLAKHTIKTLCKFYFEVLCFSKMLKNTGKGWLPDNYILPENLESWLGIDLKKMDHEIKSIQNFAKIPNIVHYFNLVDNSDSDIEITDEYVIAEYKELETDEYKLISRSDIATTADILSSIEHSEKLRTISKSLRGFDSNEDTGEEIQIHYCDDRNAGGKELQKKN